MAEKDKEKDKEQGEYHFSDPESYEEDLDLDENEQDVFAPEESDEQSESTPQPEKKNVFRNAAVVVGVLAGLVIVYQLVSWIFSAKPKTQPTAPSTIAQITKPPKKEIMPAIKQAEPVVQKALNPETDQKIAILESSQRQMMADVTLLKEQITPMNNHINQLSDQLTALNQTLERLSNQLAQQAEEISILMVRTEPKKIKVVVRRVPPIVYYIQAVIPGRAWLIGLNGSTLTVREGTRVPGYGVVRLIDSIEGKIITSSGREIRFSQNDS